MGSTSACYPELEMRGLIFILLASSIQRWVENGGNLTVTRQKRPRLFRKRSIAAADYPTPFKNGFSHRLNSDRDRSLYKNRPFCTVGMNYELQNKAHPVTSHNVVLLDHKIITH
jgi:hypothetical protein